MLAELPKSAVFTARLPADSAFPTPAASAAAPLAKLGPRMVREALFTYVRPTPATAKPPELLAVSPAAFRDLGLALSEADTPAFAALVAGNASYGAAADAADAAGIYPWAQCYGGWQFGQWAGQLGDGRAISLFEATNPATGARYELQLKGAGQTPYSRFADGRAVLRSSIREFVVSEYLHALGVPTTRALALTLLPGLHALRERLEPCAVVTRMAPSWLRIGTFDLLHARRDRLRTRLLADYVCDELLDFGPSQPQSHQQPQPQPQPQQAPQNRYEHMYREIARRNARTVAQWQAHAFMNGVLNTDNTSLLGLSLDFGPFAFMDAFDPDYTPNHDDHALRYCFRNQPGVIWWNLVRLAEDLAPLLILPDAERPDEASGRDATDATDATDAADGAEAIKRVQPIIESVGEEYRLTFLAAYKTLMTEKLGFASCRQTDMDAQFSPLLDLLQKHGLDYHRFLRKLSETPVPPGGADAGLSEALAEELLAAGQGPTTPEAKRDVLQFLHSYAARIRQDGDWDDAERMRRMKRCNPKFVPKNWVLDEAIERVEKQGDRKVLADLVTVLSAPFDDCWPAIEDAERWCGPVPLHQRALQCSCSS